MASHLSGLLSDIRREGRLLARLEGLEWDLKEARKRVTGGSSYKVLTLSVQSDFPTKSEIEDEVSLFRKQVKKGRVSHKKGERMSRDPISAREAMLEELADPELWEALKLLVFERNRGTGEGGQCATVWMVFTNSLEIINDPRTEDDPLTFSDDHWSSGTTRGKGGTNSKYLSNTNSFDTRVLEKEIKSVRSWIKKQNPVIVEAYRRLTSRIVESPDSLTVLERGSQCPSETYLKLANEGMQEGYFIWITGVDTGRRAHRWCKLCVTVAFTEMKTDWVLNNESLAPLQFTGGAADCLSDRCVGKEVDIIDQEGVLKIGFGDNRSDTLVIEGIELDSSIDLIDIRKFRSRYGSGMVIDGRIDIQRD